MTKRRPCKIVTYCVFAAFFALLLLPILSPFLTKGRTVADDTSMAEFPLALRYVDSQAFAGTSFERVSFQDNLIHIGTRAFEKNGNLTDVYIPSSVQSIGHEAFAPYVLVHGIQNSYVEAWAKKYGYCFVIEDIWSDCKSSEGIHTAVQQLMLLCFILPVVKEKTIQRIRRQRVFEKSMRPQDRIELYPINYRFP